MRYRRVLVKLSGGALAGDGGWGFDPTSIDHIADQVVDLHRMGVQVGVVVGGGNIFRGDLGEQWGIERAEADNIGMLATVINGLMLRGAINAREEGAKVRVMTAIPMDTVAEPYIRLRAISHLENRCLVVLVAGTGNPYVTTDYPSVQRALELRADAILAAKNGVDGIYTADPHRSASARRYRTIGYDTVIRQNLRALDQSAVLLARDHGLPVHVFDFDRPGAMRHICLGEEVGTVIGATHDELAEDEQLGVFGYSREQ